MLMMKKIICSIRLCTLIKIQTLMIKKKIRFSSDRRRKERLHLQQKRRKTGTKAKAKGNRVAMNKKTKRLKSLIWTSIKIKKAIQTKKKALKHQVKDKAREKMDQQKIHAMSKVPYYNLANNHKNMNLRDRSFLPSNKNKIDHKI